MQTDKTPQNSAPLANSFIKHRRTSDAMIAAIAEENGGILPGIKFARKFRHEYGPLLLQFFDRQTLEYSDVPHGKDGTKRIPISEDLPTFGRFEAEHGLSPGSCHRWAHAKLKDGAYSHPEFRDCYLTAKAMQEHILVNATLRGAYPAQGYAALVAKNLLDWKDKSEFSGPGGGAIQVEDINKLSAEELDRHLEAQIMAFNQRSSKEN